LKKEKVGEEEKMEKRRRRRGGEGDNMVRKGR
jgi:hypothetical protein